jgi:hypothetical protein
VQLLSVFNFSIRLNTTTIYGFNAFLAKGKGKTEKEGRRKERRRKREGRRDGGRHKLP